MYVFWKKYKLEQLAFLKESNDTKELHFYTVEYITTIIIQFISIKGISNFTSFFGNHSFSM